MIDLIDPEVQELAEIERKIERVARAICKRAGHDPDELVMLQERRPEFGARNNIFAYTAPAWSLYYNDAQAAVDALSEVKA